MNGGSFINMINMNVPSGQNEFIEEVSSCNSNLGDLDGKIKLNKPSTKVLPVINEAHNKMGKWSMFKDFVVKSIEEGERIKKYFEYILVILTK